MPGTTVDEPTVSASVRGIAVRFLITTAWANLKLGSRSGFALSMRYPTMARAACLPSAVVTSRLTRSVARRSPSPSVVLHDCKMAGVISPEKTCTGRKCQSD
jgi:hypothetical protein